MENKDYQEFPDAENGDMMPEDLLREFRDRSLVLDERLSALQDLIISVRSDIQDQSKQSLQRLAQAASDMANGRVYQRIDLEAKGELGALVESLNTTLTNLQQLDASVKQQSTQVPELAAQLDAITADTETATQTVMNRLDTLMNTTDQASRSLDQVAKHLDQNNVRQAMFQSQLDGFLERASGGEDPQKVAQEVLDFLYEQKMTTQVNPVDLTEMRGHMQTISDESFEILNTLQFQDITRQKVEKVVMLLKQFQHGLQRLLHIFKIDNENLAQSASQIFEHRHTATQDNIFNTTLEKDQNKESVDDIIAQFKSKKA